MAPADNIIIRVASWDTDQQALTEVRRIVFIEEQKVPEEMEWDSDDEASTHFIATKDNQAIACARLKPDGQVGRMAVLPSYRNNGIGRKLLQLVLTHAIEKNFNQLFMHAQLTAIAFYEREGFTAQGETFYEANIPHRTMLKKIC